MTKDPMQILKSVPKASLIKWLAFLIAVYALYDGVYLWADAKRLLIDVADVRSGLVPMLIVNIDVPLLIGSVILCMVFDRKRTVQALAIRNGQQLGWMTFGSVLFLLVVVFSKPAGAVAAYEVIHALVIAGLLEELIFRGLLFSWLETAGCGSLSYFLSGLAWGAHFAIRTLVISHTMTLWAVLPVALFGVLIGTLAAIVYKKSDSLWLVTYLHGALVLL